MRCLVGHDGRWDVYVCIGFFLGCLVSTVLFVVNVTGIVQVDFRRYIKIIMGKCVKKGMEIHAK